MCDLCRKRAAAYARTEAFAAIRRAAVLIRAHERMGSILDEFACFKSEAPKLRAEGQLMRLTVRAAIGSDKA
jgi:hypothetical protein